MDMKWTWTTRPGLNQILLFVRKILFEIRKTAARINVFDRVNEEWIREPIRKENLTVKVSNLAVSRMLVHCPRRDSLDSLNERSCKLLQHRHLYKVQLTKEQLIHWESVPTVSSKKGSIDANSFEILQQLSSLFVRKRGEESRNERTEYRQPTVSTKDSDTLYES